jgi:hypothetical protein
MAVTKQNKLGFVGQSVTFDSVAFHIYLLLNSQLQNFTYKQVVFS